jgi:hypothetical protein
MCYELTVPTMHFRNSKPQRSGFKNLSQIFETLLDNTTVTLHSYLVLCLFCNKINFCLLKEGPFFALFADCTSPCASSLPACLNSIMQSRKSFRTSPCFSLKTTVTNIKIIRNGRAGLHSINEGFRNFKVHHLSSKIKPYI